MQSKLVTIGNSKGVRIPKVLLEKHHFNQFIEIEEREDGIIIRPAKNPREGWEEAAKAMAAAGEDLNPWGDMPIEIESDDEEWVW